MRLTELVIDRRHWVRGRVSPHKGNDSVLLNELGNMCCLGFFALACGVPSSLLRDRSTPSFLLRDRSTPRHLGPENIPNIEQLVTGQALPVDTAFSIECMEINDDDLRFLSEFHREVQLKNYFRENGVALRFCGPMSMINEAAERARPQRRIRT